MNASIERVIVDDYRAGIHGLVTYITLLHRETLPLSMQEDQYNNVLLS